MDHGFHVSTANQRTISDKGQSADARFCGSRRTVRNEMGHQRCQVETFHPDDRVRVECNDGYSTDFSDAEFDQVCKERLVTDKFGVCNQAKHRCCCRSSVKKSYAEPEFRHRDDANCHVYRPADPRSRVSCDDSDDNSEFRNEPHVRATSTKDMQKNIERNKTQKPPKNYHYRNRQSTDSIHYGTGNLPATESAQHHPSHVRYLPHVTLGTYRGDSCLETFLSKFENISSYLCWNESDRLFHLRASLEGAAGQILWDAGVQTSASDVIRLLRARFGNENQAERFRAELRARRRRKDESLQSLYNDVCRLLALAYPGPTNPTTVLVGRDMFLDALHDQSLRVRILEREPKTLEEALNLACRLEAYDRTAVPDSNSAETYDERGRGRQRHVRTVTDSQVTSKTDEKLEYLTKKIADLCEVITNRDKAEQRKKLVD